jgi:exonuclease III
VNYRPWKWFEVGQWNGTVAGWMHRLQDKLGWHSGRLERARVDLKNILANDGCGTLEMGAEVKEKSRGLEYMMNVLSIASFYMPITQIHLETCDVRVSWWATFRNDLELQKYLEFHVHERWWSSKQA